MNTAEMEAYCKDKYGYAIGKLFNDRVMERTLRLEEFARGCAICTDLKTGGVAYLAINVFDNWVNGGELALVDEDK